MHELENVVGEDVQLHDLFVERVRFQGIQANQKIRGSIPVTIMVSALSAGVSGKVLRPLVEVIPKDVVLDAVGTDSTNFSKLTKRKHLGSKQTEELNDLTMLWAELGEFFDGNQDMVREWISKPLPAFDGAKPAELMKSHYGRDAIRKVLDEMRYGDFG